MQDQLELTVVHRLPGRLRLRFSHSPERPDRMVDHVQGHAGIDSVKFTTNTESLLIHFDQDEIAPQEILLRAGLSLSMDFGMAPVRIRIHKTNQSLGPLSALAFAVLAATHIWYMFSNKNRGTIFFQYFAYS